MNTNQKFVNKPEDYDSVVHGETRFVIFEKKAEVSYTFYFKMLLYLKVSLKKTISLLSIIAIHKTKT